MSAQDPIPGKPVSDENKQLLTLMQELEKKQLETLDEAGKRIIELTTALLGVLFAITAFGNDFPPPYLSIMGTKELVFAALLLYLFGMGFALYAVQPRSYKKFSHNLTEMRGQLDLMIQHKMHSLRFAGIFFFFASIMLALLIFNVVSAV